MVHVVTAGKTQSSASGAPVPDSQEVGDFVISQDDGGYLRKITSVNQSTGVTGEPSAITETESASLNEVFRDIAFSTTVKMYEAPLNNTSVSGASSAVSNAGFSWPESGLTLIDQEAKTVV